jgi:hypothetical protein
VDLKKKSGMPQAKYCFEKIKTALQNILRNFFDAEVFTKNVIFNMILMIIEV